MPTPFEDGQTVLFTGDSITDCGHRNNHAMPLGNGFVKLFGDMMVVREPEKQVHIVNTGIGGNTVIDLRNRWVDDVVTHHPDWVVCMVGINDCCQYLRDGNDELAPDRFAVTLTKLLAATRRALPDIKFALMDPFFAGTDNGSLIPETMHSRIAATLSDYVKGVSEAAKVFRAVHVQTNAVFEAHFQYQHPVVFFPHERVHPNPTGHMLIAEALYSELCEAE